MLTEKEKQVVEDFINLYRNQDYGLKDEIREYLHQQLDWDIEDWHFEGDLK